DPGLRPLRADQGRGPRRRHSGARRRPAARTSRLPVPDRRASRRDPAPAPGHPGRRRAAPARGRTPVTLWLAVVGACLLAWLLKLGGYLVPERVLHVPWVDRVVPLLTVALLSALVITQGFLDGSRLPTLDARAAGIGVGVGLLL